MNVYHLKVEANSRRFGELIEMNSYKSEVYSTLEKAVAEGKKWLDKRLKFLYENSSYCIQNKETLTLQDMFEDEQIYYDFRVIELDPSYADSFSIPSREYECKDLAPTHISYIYNYNAELQYKYLEYLDKEDDVGYFITRYPRRQ